MTRILLTGAGSPASQNVLQCLRMAPEQFYIVGADANRYHLEWGELDARYEAPMTSDPGYLDWLNGLIEKERIEFLHGQPDYEVAFLAEHAHLINARTFYPRPEVIQVSQNKFAACSIWAEQGLCHKPVLAKQFGFPRDWHYPVWMRATRGAGARGACKVEQPEHGEAWLRHWAVHKCEWEFMIEEYLPGTEYAWNSLWHQGKLICSSTREFVEKPMSQHMGGAGISSSYIVAKTVCNDDVAMIGERATLVLDREPHGLYSFDLKCDKDGIPRPTECNAGRFKTTSLFLAKAGCNMPWLFVQLGMLGEIRQGQEMARPDATTPGKLWIRHMDCENVCVDENGLHSIPLEAQA